MNYRRLYNYVCVFCRKKRTTKKYALSLGRVCTVCARARVEAVNDERQSKLFT